MPDQIPIHWNVYGEADNWAGKSASLFLALLRKVILLVPLAIVLPLVTRNVMGIYVAEPVADVLASATTLTLFLRKRKTLLPE